MLAEQDHDVAIASVPQAAAAPQPAATTDALPLNKILFLATGLAGSLLVNLSGQLPTANIADIQGRLASTPDEASWVLTVYTMTSFVGVVTSGLLIKTFSIGRYLIASAVVFAVAAAACAIAPNLNALIALRALQGLAAGGFGPAAFVAVFVVTGGPRLSFGLTLLAFALVFPGVIGPVVSGFVEDSFGWAALFLLQSAIGAALAVAAHVWAPRQNPDWWALKVDWIAIVLLSIGLATTMLVLSQGARRFWFESEMIAWCAAVSIAAWAAFAVQTWLSPAPIIAPRLLVSRKFGVSIGLNLVFRVGLVVTSYLVPQFLAIVQGYRPVEIAGLMLWAAIPQVFALPLVWALMQRLDLRAVMALGLTLCAAAAALAIGGTGLVAAEELRLTLVIFSLGQLFFLAPAIVIGSSSLKPADLPTASLGFNLTTLGGATMGLGLTTHFVNEREKFHSNVITESVSLYGGFAADRVSALAGALASRVADDASATAQAIALLASSARREAWVLSFNDAFLAIVSILLIGAIGTIAIGRSPRLQSSSTNN